LAATSAVLFSELTTTWGCGCETGTTTSPKSGTGLNNNKAAKTIYHLSGCRRCELLTLQLNLVCRSPVRGALGYPAHSEWYFLKIKSFLQVGLAY
jgi:hypothetical protein